MFIEKNARQLSQYIDACAVLDALAEARREADQCRGSLFWREVKGKKYLVRTTPRGDQTSLGPMTDENKNAVDAFVARKSESEARVKTLSAELDLHRKLNRSLQVGRAPDVLVNTINALDEAGLEDHFLVVGTHALYAYESAAGVLIPSEAMATQDVDFLFDTRKRVKFFSQMHRLDVSLLDVLRKADKTFRIKPDQKYTAVNDRGFEVDIIRRQAGQEDPHPLRMSDFEDDFWAVQVPSGEKLLGARRFSQVVVSSTGRMARMNTIHPEDFVRIKRLVGKDPKRDPLKAPKDLLQADVVDQLIDEYLPNLRESSRATERERQ
jgi:hypothetical protein